MLWGQNGRSTHDLLKFEKKKKHVTREQGNDLLIIDKTISYDVI